MTSSLPCGSTVEADRHRHIIVWCGCRIAMIAVNEAPPRQYTATCRRGAPHVRLTLTPIGMNTRERGTVRRRLRMVSAFAATIQELVKVQKKGGTVSLSALLLYNSKNCGSRKRVSSRLLAVLARPDNKRRRCEAQYCRGSAQPLRRALSQSNCLATMFDALLSVAMISCSPSLHEGGTDRDDLTSTIIQPCLERLKLASFISWSRCTPTAVIVSKPSRWRREI
jgi:hypothetical protein